MADQQHRGGPLPEPAEEHRKEKVPETVVQAPGGFIEHKQWSAFRALPGKHHVQLLERHHEQHSLLLPSARSIRFRIYLQQALNRPVVRSRPELAEDRGLIRSLRKASLMQLVADR